jgi:HTH-type transcriptional regulator / antitoxin HipB
MLYLTPIGVRRRDVLVCSILDLSAAVKGRRLNLGLSQTQLASQIGASRKWLSEFEAGKPTAELGLVLRALDGVGLALHLAETRDHSAGDGLDLDAFLDEYRSR